MTHSHDDPADARPQGKTERWLIRAFGVILAVAAVVSLVHLVGQYRQAGPYRATLAAERARVAAESEAKDAAWRAEREAEKARYEARGRLGSTTDALPPPVAVPNAGPSGDLSREEIERRLTERGAAITVPRRESVSAPTRWYIQPSWPSVRNDAFPPGVSQMTVQFRCRVSRDGALSNCTATEQPAGAGLADRLRPALDRARMEPMTVDGRPVESTASFGVSFSARPRPPASSAETGAPPADKPSPAPPPSVQSPPPEPAPAG